MLATRIGALVRGGTKPAEIAVLVRMNAQLAPIEQALTRAGIAYAVRGIRFFARTRHEGGHRGDRAAGADGPRARARRGDPRDLGRRARLRAR